jgi:hypothetical protein
VDADPEVHVTLRRGPGIRLGEGCLSLHGAPDRVHDTPKLRQHAIPSGIGNSASVGGNQAIENGSPLGQILEGADLVGPHQAAVSLDISSENRSQPAFCIN